MTNVVRAGVVGRWIFQRRTWLPCTLLAALFIPHTWIRDPNLQWSIGLALLAIGETLRMVSVAYAGRITRTRSGKLAPLVIAGPYRLVRNPIYLGNIMIGAGCMALLGRFILIPVVIILAILYYRTVIIWEESVLEQVFGEEYLSYRAQVPRWIPRLHLNPGEARTIHRFHISEAIRSERGTLGTLCLIGLLSLTLELVARHGYGSLLGI